MNTYTIPQIVALLAARMEELAGALGLFGGSARRDGNDLVCLNPARPDDRHVGSFRIGLRGKYQGVCKDYSGDMSYDALDLICYRLGLSKVEGIKWAKGWLGLDGVNPPPPPVVQRQRPEFEDQALEYKKFWDNPENAGKYRARALKLFLLGQNKSLRGTPVDGYLSARGINLALLGRQPRAIRYVSELSYYESDPAGKKVCLGRFPAMIALAQGPDGVPRAVHRTWLERIEGVWQKKNLANNKKMSNTYGGAFIPIWSGKSKKPMHQMTEGERVYITEGIEDALSVALHVSEYRVVCGISVSNIRNILFPETVREIVVCADNDKEGSPAALQLEKTVEALERRGHAVMIARSRVGKDFNDWQRTQGQMK